MYSSELHLIAILWRFMKYEWIGFEAYQSWKKLVEYVENVLQVREVHRRERRHYAPSEGMGCCRNHAAKR